MSENIGKCLREFICHVEKLRSEDDPAGTGFHREFRILRETQIQNKNEERFSMEDGKSDENLKKNRYKDILPRDDLRVKLTAVDGEEGSDYINATFIKDVNGEYGYIAAQGPMPHTVNDFWRMLWEYNTEIVFMACRTNEGGKPKCEKYWADKGKTATFGSITVYNDHEEEVQDHFTMRTLKATRDGQTHTLTQFHYEGWPDHDTPSSPDTLRSMIEYVRDHRRRHDIPMVVHCSAGCGRTGTICAIDYAWTLLDQGKIDSGFSLFEIIKSLREQRLSMVQTPDQYEYTHMVLKSLCEEWLQQERKHDYENMVIEGTTAEPQAEYGNVNFTHQGDAEIYSNVELQSGEEKPLPIGRVGPEETGKILQPEVVHMKPRPNSIKARASSSSKSVSQPTGISSTTDDGAGVYVMVQPMATADQKPLSPGSPPALPDKKNPPTGRYDKEKLEPQKTVITFARGGNTHSVTKTGSLGFSHTKARAPKPPAESVVTQPTKAPPPAGATVSTTSQQQAAKIVSMSVENKQKETNGAAKGLSGGNVDRPTDDAPELPGRFYRPDEVHSAAPSGKQHSYDNIAPAAKGRGQPQPDPRPDPVVVNTSRAVQPQPRPTQPLQATHPTMMTSRQLQHFPADGGVVSAPIAPARHGWGLSGVRGAQPRKQMVFSGPASSPSQGGLLSQLLPKKAQKAAKGHVKQVPLPLEGRIVYTTQRLNRVRGPRPMPQEWRRSQTYL